MKFLVYGGEGFIGKSIVSTLKTTDDTIIAGKRVTSYESAWDDLQQHHPDFVICSVGRTYGPGCLSSDYLEQKGTLHDNVTANLSVPVFVAQASNDFQPKPIPMLYIGTGCIFDSTENNTANPSFGFAEDDVPNFFASSYSIVKGQTDQILKHFPNVLCARIRMPIMEESHPREFITKILGYENVLSRPNSFTVLHDIIPLLIGCLVNGNKGIINAVNPGVITHEEIIKLHEMVNDTSHNYRLTNEELAGSLSVVPHAYNRLNCQKLQKWILKLPTNIVTKYGIRNNLEDISTRVKSILRNRQEQNGRRILVTGALGFIGSNFINYWMEKYPKDAIVNFDLGTAKELRMRNIENPENPKYTFVEGDILNQRLLKSTFDQHNFTHIIHFAALCNVDQSFIIPFDFTRTNVLGTQTLLEVIKTQKNKPLLIFISTDEVYGENSESSSCESTAYRPTNPYAATKVAAESLVMAYGKSFGLRYMITRGNNIYGKYQLPAQVIPKFILSILAGKKMPVQGKGKAIRR